MQRGEFQKQTACIRILIMIKQSKNLK